MRWIVMSLLWVLLGASSLAVQDPTTTGTPSTTTPTAPAGAPAELEETPRVYDSAPLVPVAPPQVRISDLVEIDGVRNNQLVGTGIVTGLGGTGDNSIATRRALSNFVRRHGLQVQPSDITLGNVALVSVTGTLEAFAAAGTSVDVQVQSVGDASSLFGGHLLQTPLRGADGRVYVVAQGPLLLGGFHAEGEAARITRNHPLVGTVAGGGLVERTVEMKMMHHGLMHLHLRAPNAETATRVVHRIGGRYPGIARAINPRTIRIHVPEAFHERPVDFFASIGALEVAPGEDAVLVINERTGTIVAGHRVRISTAAITHGNLTVSIAESPIASQPAPFSDGQTTVLPRTDLQADEERRELMVVPSGTSATELANALNRLGVSPRDLVSIFLALKRAGHLHARLEVL